MTDQQLADRFEAWELHQNCAQMVITAVVPSVRTVSILAKTITEKSYFVREPEEITELRSQVTEHCYALVHFGI
jgi:hypothetical protein